MKSGRNRAGFTLVEIMIVVSIIGLLSVIAIPSFLKARNRAQVTRVANDLRVFADGFQMYVMAHGKYPPDTHNTLPPGMHAYIKQASWDADALGGHYNWEGPDWGEGGGYKYAGIALFETTIAEEYIEVLDEILDDGNLGTGIFKIADNGRYTYIIEERK